MSAEVRTARTVFTATTRDLSEGGAGLNADRPLQEGEEVTIGLFLVLDDVEADTPPLWVKGRVAWARERSQPPRRRRPLRSHQRRAATWLRQVLASWAARLEARLAAAGRGSRSATRTPSSAALTMPPA